MNFFSERARRGLRIFAFSMSALYPKSTSLDGLQTFFRRERADSLSLMGERKRVSVMQDVPSKIELGLDTGPTPLNCNVRNT